MNFVTLMIYADYVYIYIGVLMLFLVSTIAKQYSDINFVHESHKQIINLFAVSLVSMLICIKLHLSFLEKTPITNLIVVFVGMLLLIYIYAKRKTMDIELYTILLLVYWSFMVLLDSSDVIVLYASLELQTFCYCILITWQKRRTLFGAEGALKYFLFGNLASILFILGGLYVYFSVNVTDLTALSEILYLPVQNTYGTSAFFFAVAFMFKLGAVPFQFWLPDAYEAASLDMLYLLAFSLKYLFIIYFIVFNIYLPVMDFLI